MAISREKLCAVNDQIHAIEQKLKLLKAKRAGFANGHGWRYCECGQTNQLMDSPVECRGCDDLRAQRTVLAHDAGEHVVCPAPTCLQCAAIGAK
jgi:hypothetical protein